MDLKKEFEKETGTERSRRCDSFDYEYAYIEWLEQRLKTRQHEPIVMPPLSVKAKRTMPVEMVAIEEYEQIKTFYKDVYHLLGSMNYESSAKNITELLNHAKAFVDKHEY